MSNLRILLTATALSIACACMATGALAAQGDQAPLARSPIAAIARAHGKGKEHAHATCKSAHGRRRTHPHNCRAHKQSAHAHANTHGNGREAAGTRMGGGLGTRRANRLHATGARRHQAEPTTTVTLGGSPTAATITSVLATPCENTELTPEASNLAQVEEATLCLIDQERARNDELPLRTNSTLTRVAREHSEDMLANDYFSHTTPSGETQLERVLASGYIPNSRVGYTIGENIAWATFYLATPRAIVAAWIASPEHLANILDSEYRDSGIGIDPAVPQSLGAGQPGAVYTQEFGAIQG